MRRPWLVVLFAAAMGILEAAVVVYLRRIYYPAGFGFPLVPMDPTILRVEVIREAMTIVMLTCVAGLAAERIWPRLMAFIVAFGVWDLVYYAGLKLWLGWPASWLAPDILFLIPRAWVGPVLAPALVSALWIAAGLTLHRRPVRMRAVDWIGAIASAGIVVASFWIPLGAPEHPRFAWWVFTAGYLAGVATLFRLAWRPWAPMAQRIPGSTHPTRRGILDTVPKDG
jgi:hypothetical protein